MDKKLFNGRHNEASEGLSLVGLLGKSHPQMQGRNYSREMVFSRNELVTTLTELIAIAPAARIGWRNPFSPNSQWIPTGTPPID